MMHVYVVPTYKVIDLKLLTTHVFQVGCHWSMEKHKPFSVSHIASLSGLL